MFQVKSSLALLEKCSMSAAKKICKEYQIHSYNKTMIAEIIRKEMLDYYERRRSLEYPN